MFWIFSFILSAQAAELSSKYSTCINSGATLAIPAAAEGAPFEFISVEPADLPKTEGEGDLAKFKEAIEHQLEACRAQDLTANFQIDKRILSRFEWCILTNKKILSLIPESKTFAELMQKVKSEFHWYKSASLGEKEEVTFSSYRMPTIDVSLTKKGEFKFPLYKTPKDLVSVFESGKMIWRRKKSDGSIVPYFDREAIDFSNVLKGKGLEIAYAKSLVDIFIFQSQGGGVGYVATPNKDIKKIALKSDSQNSLPAASIAQMLKCSDVSEEEQNVPGFRKFFGSNKKLLLPVFKFSPNYVFFRREDKLPVSAVNIALTPRHSLAVDRKMVPIGVPLLFTVKNSDKEYASMAIAQDVVGAQTGGGSFALFLGEGDPATDVKQSGVFYVGVPKVLDAYETFEPSGLKD